MILDVCEVAHPHLHQVHHFEQQVVGHAADRPRERLGHLFGEHRPPLRNGCLGFLLVAFDVVEPVADVLRVEVLKLLDGELGP